VLCVASAATSETFRFKSPYKMADHGSIDNSIHWNDGHIEYRELHTVVNEAVAYGVSKCTFLGGLTVRPIHKLEDVNRPSPDSFNHDRCCTLPQVSQILLCNQIAHSLYDLLMYYLQKKDYVQCPPDMTRHTAEFVAAL